MKLSCNEIQRPYKAISRLHPAPIHVLEGVQRTNDIPVTTSVHNPFGGPRLNKIVIDVGLRKSSALSGEQVAGITDVLMLD